MKGCQESCRALSRGGVCGKWSALFGSHNLRSSCQKFSQKRIHLHHIHRSCRQSAAYQTRRSLAWIFCWFVWRTLSLRWSSWQGTALLCLFWGLFRLCHQLMELFWPQHVRNLRQLCTLWCQSHQLARILHKDRTLQFSTLICYLLEWITNICCQSF